MKMSPTDSAFSLSSLKVLNSLNLLKIFVKCWSLKIRERMILRSLISDFKRFKVGEVDHGLVGLAFGSCLVFDF